MSEQRRGVLFGLGAYLLWGLFPLYWPLLEPAGAGEILAHRILWSLVVVGALLALGRAGSRLPRVTRRQLVLLSVAAVVVALNWGVYIYGVNAEEVVQTALGYFINPLVSVVLGVVVLGERLRRVQWVAVGIGAAAVVVLTVDYGRPPWIALVLALSFGTYGLLKKRAAVDAVPSLSIETGVLVVPALVFLLVLTATGHATATSHGPDHFALLAGTGFVTAVPLLLFGAAANRVPLSTIGLMQYLAPVLQFVIGVAVRHEEMPTSRYVGFALVWVALLVLVADAAAGARRRAVAVPPAVLTAP